MASDPERLRRQAQSISSGSKDPKEAWKGLREWASERGPMAMDIAIHEFLTTHGRDPSAASLMPNVMHGMTTLPLKEPAELPRKREPELSPYLSMSPRSNLALTKERPAAIRPINVMAIPTDPTSMRDMPMRMHEEMKQSLRLPLKPDETKRSKSRGRTIEAGKAGHHILHSLIRHVSSHGRSDAPRRRKSKKAKPDLKKAIKKTQEKPEPKARKAAPKKTMKKTLAKPKRKAKSAPKTKKKAGPKPAKKKPKAKKARPKTRKSAKKRARPKPRQKAKKKPLPKRKIVRKKPQRHKKGRKR